MLVVWRSKMQSGKLVVQLGYHLSFHHPQNNLAICYIVDGEKNNCLLQEIKSYGWGHMLAWSRNEWTREFCASQWLFEGHYRVFVCPCEDEADKMCHWHSCKVWVHIATFVWTGNDMLCTQNSVIVITFRYILVLDITMVVKMTILVATDDYLSGFHGCGIVPTMHPQCTTLYPHAPHCTRPAPTLSTQCAHCSTAHAPHTNLNPVLLGFGIYLSFYVFKKEKLVRESVKYY